MNEATLHYKCGFLLYIFVTGLSRILCEEYYVLLHQTYHSAKVKQKNQLKVYGVFLVRTVFFSHPLLSLPQKNEPILCHHFLIPSQLVFC